MIKPSQKQIGEEKVYFYLTGYIPHEEKPRLEPGGRNCCRDPGGTYWLVFVRDFWSQQQEKKLIYYSYKIHAQTFSPSIKR